LAIFQLAGASWTREKRVFEVFLKSRGARGLALSPPRKRGSRGVRPGGWIPAFAGMTGCYWRRTTRSLWPKRTT